MDISNVRINETYKFEFLPIGYKVPYWIVGKVINKTDRSLLIYFEQCQFEWLEGHNYTFNNEELKQLCIYDESKFELGNLE